jgi:hypothetical protein
LLDHLPKAALDESFTRTTVQMVAVAASEDVASQAAELPVRRRRRLTAGVVCAVAAAVVGFIAVIAAWPDQNQALLRDLPVIKNFELYEMIPRGDAAEFLRELEKEELFTSEATDDSPASTGPEPTGEVATRDVLSARREEVEQLAADKKADLRKLFDRFQAKSEEEKAHLRAVDAALRSEPDEARLRALLQSYHGWLPMLSPLERNELPKMTVEGAIAEIRRLKQLELRRLAMNDRFRQGPLTKRDVNAIEQWQQDRAWKRKDEILGNASDEDREWFNGLTDKQQRRALVFLAMPARPGPPQAPKLDPPDWQDLLGQLPTVKALFEGRVKDTDEPLKSLAKPVRDKVKEELSKATTPEEQQRLLFNWQMAALRARDAVGGGVSGHELQRFFDEELAEKKREELSLLPPEEFHRKLRFEYFVKKELPPGRWKRGPWGRGQEGGRGRSDDDRRRRGPDRNDNRSDNGDEPRRGRQSDGDHDRKSGELRSGD